MSNSIKVKITDLPQVKQKVVLPDEDEHQMKEGANEKPDKKAVTVEVEDSNIKVADSSETAARKKEAADTTAAQEVTVGPAHRTEQLLQITDLSMDQIPVSGGQKIILLCSRIDPEDNVQVWIEKEDPPVQDEAQNWKVRIPDDQVTLSRHGGGISFVAPAYRNPDIVNPVTASIYLFRPSDGQMSEKLALKYYPVVKEDILIESPLAEDINDSLITVADDAASLTGIREFNHTDNNSPETILPMVLDSYSIPDMPMDDSEILGEKWNTNTSEAVNRALVTARSLLKALNKEKEANKILAESVDKLKKELSDSEAEKISLKSENEAKTSEIKTLEKDSERLEAKLSKQNSEKNAAQTEVLLLERKELMRVRTELDRLASLNQDLKINLRDQSKGVENLLWQLDQKEGQVKVLEQRLRETFPVPQVTAVTSSIKPSNISSSSSGESCDEAGLKKNKRPASGASKSSTSKIKRRKTESPSIKS